METKKLDERLIKTISEQSYLFIGTTTSDWNYRAKNMKSMPMYADKWGNSGIGTNAFYDPKEAINQAVEEIEHYGTPDHYGKTPLLVALESGEYIRRMRPGRPVSGIIIEQPVFYNDIELVTDQADLFRVLRKMPDEILYECNYLFGIWKFGDAKKAAIRTGITVFN